MVKGEWWVTATLTTHYSLFAFSGALAVLAQFDQGG